MKNILFFYPAMPAFCAVRRLAMASLVGLGLTLGLGLGSGLATFAAAATTSVFEPVQNVQGADLVLNGAGTRYKAIFKVYDLALYSPKKVKTVEDLIAMPGPKKLSFVALRDIPGTDLGVSFIRGLSNNSSHEQITKYTSASNRLVEIFSGRTKLVAGDTFAMEFVPGKGTQFYIKGVPQGAPVGTDEYFAMILRVWLGQVPVDFKLKDALLGLG